MNKIKILKDTPFDKANTILTIEEFRKKYSYLVSEHNSNLISFFKIMNNNYNEDVNLSEFFEVMILNIFKESDWVWHEKIQKAFFVVNHSNSKDFHPNHCTLGAVNENPLIYKRKATVQEINNNTLYTFCNGYALISKNCSYYFNNVWKEIIGIEVVLLKYLHLSTEFHGNISVLDPIKKEKEATWQCQNNGLRIGCQEFTNEEILKIAKILNLK